MTEDLSKLTLRELLTAMATEMNPKRLLALTDESIRRLDAGEKPWDTEAMCTARIVGCRTGSNGMSEATKPNCYECKHSRSIPGDCHLRCAHPNIPDFGSMMEIAALIGGGAAPLKVTGMKVSGDPHGIRMGWFMWPLNFDPTWLESCDSFESKKVPA